MSTKKLFLLDSMALVYRAFFAFSTNPRITSKGLNTSAIFGFTNTLLEVITKEKPTHIAVVTDTAAPTERHTDFVEYKANRQEMPDDLRIALPWVQKVVEAFNIPFIAMDGYEADDIIGTLAKMAEVRGFDEIFMMTPDKDFGQLVTERIKMYKPASFGKGPEKLGIEQVCKRWELQNVNQVIDILGLMGDSVDNIPGIPGVGEKTAIQLVKDFGSIENLYLNTNLLKGKLKEKVEANKALALLSKKLATIITNVPIEFNEEALLYTGPNADAMREIFLELEFRNLIKRVLGEELPVAAAVPAAATGGQIDMFSITVTETTIITEEPAESEPPIAYKTINDVPHEYKLVETKADLDSLITLLNNCKEFCFDTETTSTDALTAELVGMSFAVESGKAFYVPIEADRTKATETVTLFKPVFENAEVLKTGQNIKYDITVLENYGINFKGPFFDTMLAHYLLQPDARHGMDIMAENYLGYSPISITTLIGKKGKDQGNMRDIPPAIVAEYASEDADITLQLKNKLQPELEQNNCLRLFNDIEIPLVKVLADMEREGINVNVASLKEFSAELSREIATIDKEIIELAGTPFNIASPKQLGDILFEVLRIDEKAKKTKTGQYATGEEILAKLENKHPIVSKILDYRELVKLQNTYVDSLPLLINPNTGHIHTSYNQAVAATGRLSSNNPNLQNIPIRTPKGKEIRKAFISRNDDFLLLSADYSQIELRIIAQLSGDKGMIEAFQNNEDIHTATAAKVWGVANSEVTKEMRNKAKTVNFGIIYGISAFGLSERINIPRSEAKEIITQYFIKYPGIKAYMDNTILDAREKGYVETIMGRRRYLRDINAGNAVVRGFAERNAINAPIQGSAADMIKMAMINVYKEMGKRNLKSKMILQVHDELVFDCYIPETEELKSLVKTEMQNAIKMEVPIEVETGIGKNWLEAH